MNPPEGWPTDEMVDKAVIVLRDRAYIPLEDGRRLANLMIRAAFAAAPTPPTQEDAPVGFISQYGLNLIKERSDTSTTVSVAFERQGAHTIPLYTRPDDKLRRAAEELIATYDFACKEDGCYASNNHVEALRAALEK